MNQAVIDLGSNINPDENIFKAVELLKKSFCVEKVSEFVRTKAIGGKGQADYINGAVLVSIDITAEQLKLQLELLEKRLGRKRSGDKFAARTIDMDIIVWNGEVVHQDFYEREFVRNYTLQVLPGLVY